MNGSPHLLNQRPKRMLFVGLDLETTDTDPGSAAIVQFASVVRCPSATRLLNGEPAYYTARWSITGLTSPLPEPPYSFDVVVHHGQYTDILRSCIKLSDGTYAAEYIDWNGAGQPKL